MLFDLSRHVLMVSERRPPLEEVRRAACPWGLKRPLTPPACDVEQVASLCEALSSSMKGTGNSRGHGGIPQEGSAECLMHSKCSGSTGENGNCELARVHHPPPQAKVMGTRPASWTVAQGPASREGHHPRRLSHGGTRRESRCRTLQQPLDRFALDLPWHFLLALE